MTHHIYVSNNLKQNLQVLAFPNPDWVWADMAVALASLAFDGKNAIKSATDLCKALYIIKGLGTASGAALKLTEFFQENGCVIEPGRSKNVYDKTNWNITSPSYWGAISGASTVTLVVCSADFSLSTQFNSNDDFSWIAGERDIVRAHTGRLWVPDPNAGIKDWDDFPPIASKSRQGNFSTPRTALALWQPYGSPLFFAQGSDRQWDVGSIQSHGCYSGALQQGIWGAYYASLSPYEAAVNDHDKLSEPLFCFQQRSSDSTWFIQGMDPNGTWGKETDSGTWGKFYPVTLSFGNCSGKKWAESIDTGRSTTTAQKSSSTPKYLFAHAPDQSWFLREMLYDGKMGKEVAKGVWKDYYSSCTDITVKSTQYLVGQSQKTFRWFIQPFQKNNFGSETDYGAWGDYFPVMTTFALSGKSYLYRQSENGRWFINEVLSSGKMGDLVGEGYQKFYKTTAPFTTRGTPYLLMIADSEWCIKEISKKFTLLN